MEELKKYIKEQQGRYGFNGSFSYGAQDALQGVLNKINEIENKQKK